MIAPIVEVKIDDYNGNSFYIIQDGKSIILGNSLTLATVTDQDYVNSVNQYLTPIISTTYVTLDADYRYRYLYG